jgi:hypothetical protein
LQVCAAHRHGWNSSLNKVLTALFGNPQVAGSETSALATPTFNRLLLGEFRNAFAHIELFAF